MYVTKEITVNLVEGEANKHEGDGWKLVHTIPTQLRDHPSDAKVMLVFYKPPNEKSIQ